MPQRHGWLTPDALPSGTRCVTLNVPDDDDFWAMLKGAIEPLFRSSQFEEHGTLTPEECAQWWVDWDAGNDWSGCEVSGLIIGEVRAIAATTPPDGWLACDGSALDKIEYAGLFSAIGGTFGQAGDYFYLPDLRSRAIVGAGTGTSLTDRVVSDQGGEETHVLTTAEIPAHNHPITRRNVGGGAISTIEFTTTANNTGNTNTGNRGDGGAHQNMMPFLVLQYYIYAGTLAAP